MLKIYIATTTGTMLVSGKFNGCVHVHTLLLRSTFLIEIFIQISFWLVKMGYTQCSRFLPP